MPQAVTHILIPLILSDYYRDHISKKKFNLHYIFISGISGLLPDIDVIAFWILNFISNTQLSSIHRAFTHTLFLPLLFLILFFLTKNIKLKKPKLKLNYIFLAIAFGTFIHLILDSLLSGYISPFYPLSTYQISLNLIPLNKFQGTLFPGLDAILLVLWLYHEEKKHKISDYI